MRLQAVACDIRCNLSVSDYGTLTICVHNINRLELSPLARTNLKWSAALFVALSYLYIDLKYLCDAHPHVGHREWVWGGVGLCFLVQNLHLVSGQVTPLDDKDIASWCGLGFQGL
jgi:hypothetical protein